MEVSKNIGRPNNMVFIPARIYVGLKYLGLKLKDFAGNKEKAFSKLSEADKAVIDGLNNDYFNYLHEERKYTVKDEERPVDREVPIAFEIVSANGIDVVGFGENFDINEIDKTKIFRPICKEIVDKYKEESFSEIYPSTISGCY